MKDNKSSVDNYIITTCITLITAFVIMLTIETPANKPLSVSVILSMLCLILTFLGSLWHKGRWNYRTAFFKRERERIIHEFANDVTKFAHNFWEPRLRLKFFQYLPVDSEGSEPKSKEKSIESVLDDLSRQVIEENTDKYEETTKVYITNFLTMLQSVRIKAFHAPLNEKYAKLKYYADILSHKTRYYLFVIGIIFFFISVLLNLI